jgi:hypothetical protein
MAEDTRQPTGLIASSDYKLTTLSIITSTGDLVDVKPIMIELHLYEDIFGSCMTGSMILGDGADIISSYQLHGNEFVILSVDKPSLNQPITKTFRIFKISNRRMDETALQNYTIHFCSEELILSTQSSLSVSYKGMRISDMVKDILKNRLLTSSTKMGGIFTNTTGNFDLIVPRMQPLEAIGWMTPKAYNANENLFMFFENRDGFNFTSYENLLKIPPYSTYVRIAKTNQDPAQNMFGYNELIVGQDFDIIKSMRFGTYATSLLTVDTLNRNLSGFTFGYKQINAKTGLLNHNLPDSGLKNRLGFGLSDSKSSMIKMMPSTDSDPSTNPANIKNWMAQQIARLGQVNQFKMTMALPGDVLLKAGRVVTVAFPKMQPQDKSIVTDNMRTGNYMISAIRHTFRQDVMASVVELVSDSVGVALAGAQNGNAGIQALVKK